MTAVAARRDVDRVVLSSFGDPFRDPDSARTIVHADQLAADGCDETLVS